MIYWIFGVLGVPGASFIRPGEADGWEDRMLVGGVGEGAALGGKWLHEAQDTAGLRKEFLRQLLDPKASTEMKALPGLARRKDRAL